jgi:hypothetical protein
MATLSDHTRLINLLITLAHKTPDLKSPLNQLGYDLEHIGLKIAFADGTGLDPDLSFKSHKRTALLLAEAKSGGVDNEQAKKYKALTPNDISRLGLTDLPAPNLSIQVFYACTKANRDMVMANEAKFHWGFPILTFDGKVLKKEEESAPFQDEEIERLFSTGVGFDHEPPLTFFPFGEGDSDGWVVLSVLYELAVLWTRQETTFTPDQLLRQCHRLFGYFDKEEKRRLLGITKSALDKINKSGSTRFAVRPLRGDKWQIVKFSIGRLGKNAITFLADSFDQKRPTMDLQKFLDDEARRLAAEESKGQS